MVLNPPQKGRFLGLINEFPDHFNCQTEAGHGFLSAFIVFHQPQVSRRPDPQSSDLSYQGACVVWWTQHTPDIDLVCAHQRLVSIKRFRSWLNVHPFPLKKKTTCCLQPVGTTYLHEESNLPPLPITCIYI